MKLASFVQRPSCLLGIGLLLLLSGCSTMATVAGGIHPKKFRCSEGHVIPRIYSGVANDIRFLAEGAEGHLVALFDLPLSFVADTAILPYTIVTEAKYGHLCDGSTDDEAKAKD